MTHSVRLAGDLALVGILVTIGSLPILTAGAAIAAGSAAIHHQLEYGRWPTAAELWHIFRRGLVRGLAAGPLLLVAVALIVIDVAALRRGVVPGGAPALTLVLVAFSLAAGWASLVAVEAGKAASATIQPDPSSTHAFPSSAAQPLSTPPTPSSLSAPSTRLGPSGTSAPFATFDASGSGESVASGGAVRAAWRHAVRRPLAVVAAAAVLLIAVILAVLIHPVLTPVFVGFVLFALHVVARRLPSYLLDQGHKLG